MSDIAVRHTLTNIVSTIPEEHLDFFKDAEGNRVFVEVTEDEIVEMRREAERQMYGYTLDEAPATTPDESWTKAQLVEYANENNIEVDSSARKADILDAVTTEGTE